MKKIILLAFLIGVVSFASAADPAAGKERLWKQNGVNNWFKDAAGACVASMNTSPYPFVSARLDTSGLYADCIGVDNNQTPPKNIVVVGVGAVDVTACAVGEVRNFPSASCIKKPEEEKKCKDAPGTKVYVTIQEGFSPIGENKAASDSNSAKYGFPTQNATCKFAGNIPQDLTVEHCDTTIVGGMKRYTCTYSAKTSGVDADPNIVNGGVTAPGADGKPTSMTPKPAEKGACPQGSVGGMVDGVMTCFGEGVNPTQPTKTPTTTNETKATDANGNEVKTNVKTTTNADGSETKQTTVTTVKPDGSVETKSYTETTKAPTGDNGKEDKPETDFCKANPSLTICKNSVAKGNCGAVTCQGDAIQCEMLIQQTALRCSAEEDKKDLEASGLNALGKAVAGGNDPLASSLPSPGKATAISVPASLTTSGWLGGGQCFPDKSVTVMGKTIALPFGKACDGLLTLRYALMVAASLVSFKILRGAFLSE